MRQRRLKLNWKRLEPPPRLRKGLGYLKEASKSYVVIAEGHPVRGKVSYATDGPVDTNGDGWTVCYSWLGGDFLGQK